METKLDLILKNYKKHICVKYQDGSVDRILYNKAHKLVTKGEASFISKTEYKSKTRSTKPEPVIEQVVEQENVETKVKMKAKEIRAKNKKQK